MSVIILYCQCFKHHFLIKVRLFETIPDILLLTKLNECLVAVMLLKLSLIPALVMVVLWSGAWDHCRDSACAGTNTTAGRMNSDTGGRQLRHGEGPLIVS